MQTPIKLQCDSKGRFVKTVRATPVQSAARIDSRSSHQTVFVPKRGRFSNSKVVITKF